MKPVEQMKVFVKEKEFPSVGDEAILKENMPGSCGKSSSLQSEFYFMKQRVGFFTVQFFTASGAFTRGHLR